MKPITLKITNPPKKLVIQLIVATTTASLTTKEMHVVREISSGKLWLRPGSQKKIKTLAKAWFTEENKKNTSELAQRERKY